MTTFLIYLAIQVYHHLGHLYLACHHLDFHHLEWCLAWCHHHVCLRQVCLLQECQCLLLWGCHPALAVSGLSIAQQMGEYITTTLEPCSRHGRGPRRWTRYHPQCKGCHHQVQVYHMHVFSRCCFDVSNSLAVEVDTCTDIILKVCGGTKDVAKR